LRELVRAALGSDHPFWDSASYITEMAETN
jgi:hypothetical protein